MTPTRSLKAGDLRKLNQASEIKGKKKNQLMEIINGKQIYDSKLRVNCAHLTYKKCVFVLEPLSLSSVCVFVSHKKKKKKKKLI